MTTNVNWQINNSVHIHPDKLVKIQFEPTSYCNLRCPGCSRTDEYTGLAKKDVIKYQQHIPMSLIKPIFSNLPNLKEVKMDGDIGDAMMHPHLDKICEMLIEMYPNIYIQINTNGTPGKDSVFTKLLRMKNVMFVLGIDGLEDTNHLHRVGANWKIIKRRLELIKNIAPDHHKWRWLDFKHTRHQLDEALEVAKYYRIRNLEVGVPYSGSDGMMQEVIKERQEGIRDSKGRKEKKEEKFTPEPYELPNIHQHIIEEKLLKKDELFSCPWQGAKLIQVMSTGQIWPCCWSSQMQISTMKFTADEIVSEYYLEDNMRYLQVAMTDWYSKISTNWVKEITVTPSYTLRDVLLGKSYRKLAMLLKPQKEKYNLSYCNITCGKFTEVERNSSKGDNLSSGVGIALKKQILIDPSGPINIHKGS
tara:strand:+ start:2565 stop:3818 length:1254 start_codon:yes stop_codon:yes gene_type:complete